jgi:hypothetical protein
VDEKLKACKDALDDLRVTQDRHAAIKADFTKFREQARKEMAPGNSRLSITVAEDTATSFVIEHLDRRAKVAFHVTARATPSPLSDAPAVPLFDFSFDGGGKTNLPPPKFADPLSLRIDDDVLCILLNIVDRLIERPHPDH